MFIVVVIVVIIVCTVVIVVVVHVYLLFCIALLFDCLPTYLPAGRPA